ncbi:MAG TPA: hypothetical protein VFS45_05095 [Sphingomicrobium sp.]|nr:hypothetical protein [Sphingomicrobium sp.]
MPIPRPRTLAIVIAAGIGLGGCAAPFGYGSGVSVGYGNQGYYDPYYDRYGYGSPYGYGYSPYGYRPAYGYAPYWGWNDGYYYPGTGYYVYDRYRRPRVWTDAERQYWTERASSSNRTTTGRLLDNWADFSSGGQAVSKTSRSTQTSSAVTSGDSTFQDRRAVRRAMRVERSNRTVGEPRQSTRSERRIEARSSSSEWTGGRRATVRESEAVQPE